MAFGNPYGDLWNAEEVIEAVGILADMNITQISLADTVGLSTPTQVKDLIAAVTSAYDYLEIGAHLHSTQAGAAEKIIAAYDAGCRRFDSAIGGLGGCPFAQDEMIGNIPTEIAVQALHGTRRRRSAEEAAGLRTRDVGRHRKEAHGGDVMKRLAIYGMLIAVLTIAWAAAHYYSTELSAVVWHARHGFHAQIGDIRVRVPLAYEADDPHGLPWSSISRMPGCFSGPGGFIMFDFRRLPSPEDIEAGEALLRQRGFKTQVQRVKLAERPAGFAGETGEMY